MTEKESRTREREIMRALLLVLPVGEGEEHGKAVLCVSGKRESLSRDETSSAPLILLL